MRLSQMKKPQMLKPMKTNLVKMFIQSVFFQIIPIMRQKILTMRMNTVIEVVMIVIV